MNERALATLLVPVVLAVAFGAAVLVAHLGGAAHDSARLQASADVTALAAVTGGEAAAATVARANGSTVLATATAGRTTTVVVAAGGLERRAAAAPMTDAGG